MNTKRLFCGSLSFLMALTLTACASEKKEDEGTATADPSKETEEPAKESEEPVKETEWTVNGSYSVLLAETDKELFAKTLESDQMTDKEAIILLGEQTVSGMNYAYLDFNTSTVPGTWEISVIYQDTEGNSQFINTAELIPENIGEYTVKEPGEDLLGGWSYRSSGKPGALTEKGEAALSAALQKAGITMMPIALLASSEATNEYLFVCFNTVDEKNTVCFVTVKDEEIVDSSILDMGKIVQPENKE